MSWHSDFDSMLAEFYKESGFTATYTHTTSVPNDATGVNVITTTSIPVEAIKMELIRPTEGSGSKNGTLIQDGDLTLYVRPTEKSDEFADALTVDPTSDSFVINGVSWSIVTVKRYEPDATNCILYEFYIRK